MFTLLKKTVGFNGSLFQKYLNKCFKEFGIKIEMNLCDLLQISEQKEQGGYGDREVFLAP